MTDWDKFEAETANAPMSKIIDELKEQRRVRDDATKRVEQLEAKIVSEFPEEFGDQTKVYGDDVVTINRQERFNWDQDILDDIFKAKPLPDHVKRRLTVDKRTFQKLTETDQEVLAPALTRKPGPVSVKLTRSK
tara:strand:+ start:126 stop:527 length:402 start_codon:yes stop_codon:yes gene_type:complete